MEVIPAIDIKGGRCVRLYQGDYERETVYSESPPDVARQWSDMGARRLHVVDLDGAKAGGPVNFDVVREIASAVDVPVQLGGGIGTLKVAREALSFGVSRVIVGTAAVEDPALLEELCRELDAEAVVVSVDARDGIVLKRGWTESSREHVSDVVDRIEQIGVRRFVYTDVGRDGTLTEPNFPSIEALERKTPLKIVVAGGISSIDHLVRLSELGVEAAIVGKAVYSGDIELPQAIEAVSSNGKITA